MARRAYRQATQLRSQFSSTPEQHQQLTLQFLQTRQRREMERLHKCLANDIIFWSEGGEQVITVLKPL